MAYGKPERVSSRDAQSASDALVGGGATQIPIHEGIGRALRAPTGFNEGSSRPGAQASCVVNRRVALVTWSGLPELSEDDQMLEAAVRARTSAS
jgi:hypothetical protein